MVFVLSALQPGAEWERAMNNVWRVRPFAVSSSDSTRGSLLIRAACLRTLIR